MTQSLTIAVTRKMPGWKILLSQIGLPEQPVNWEKLQPENYAAVIVVSRPNHAEREALEQYMLAGGAVLDAGGLLAMIDPGSFSRARLSTIVASPEEKIFTSSRIVDLLATGRVHREAEHLERRVYLGAHGRGFVAQLPFDPDRLVRDIGSRRKQFPVASGPMPDEVVAKISKGEVRRIVERSLEWLIAQRSLPWVHLWRFPGRSRSIFSFRIDSDYGTRPQIMALARSARAHDIRMSWFIHVEPQQEMLDLFRSFEGDELGLHAWRHRTFGSYEQNAANISEAATVLRRAGIEPRGFAAPLGRWNSGLAQALEEHGFDYSSEFALDHDDLPFLPLNPWRTSPVMQIPIHPVSIGNFLRVKASDAEMIDYYRSVIDAKLAAMEPVILYGHPGHERLEVIDAIFERMSGGDVPNMTMGQYARWWRSRLDVRFEGMFDGTRITLKSNPADETTKIRVVKPDGDMAFVATDGAFDLEALEWEKPPVPVSAPAGLRRARGFSLRLLRHAIEDFNSIIRQ